EQLLRVARVAREHDRRIAGDDDRDMVRRVARCRDDHYVAAPRQRHRLLERAERLTIEADELRLPPLRPSVREIALHASTDAAGAIELSTRHPRAAAGHVEQSAGV